MKKIIILSGVIAAAGLGYYFGRPNADFVAEAPNLIEPVAVSAFSHNAAVQPPAKSVAVSGDPSELLVSRQTPASLLDELSLAVLDTDHPEREADLTNDLLTLALDNPASVDILMERFQQSPEGLLGERLILVLSQLDSPKVTKMAAEMAASGAGTETRMAALMLLSESVVGLAEIQPVLQDILTYESDPELVAMAARAIDPASMSSDQLDELHSELQSLLSHSSTNVRKESLIALARIPGGAPMETFLDALQDPSTDVRMGAISAMMELRGLPESAQNSLVQVMSDSNEDIELRMHAWYALGSLPMTDQTAHAHREFEQFALQ